MSPFLIVRDRLSVVVWSFGRTRMLPVSAIIIISVYFCYYGHHLRGQRT